MEQNQNDGAALLTWLCPACDGWGRTGGEYQGGYGYHADPADYAPEWTCLDCDESGVLVLPRAEGERRGLQPWTGDEGRALSRNRIVQSDPLLTLAKYRHYGRHSVADYRAKIERNPGFDPYLNVRRRAIGPRVHLPGATA